MATPGSEKILQLALLALQLLPFRIGNLVPCQGI